MAWLTGLEHILRQDQSLAPYCWLGLGGSAEYFAEPTTQDELLLLVQRCRDHDVPVRLLGGGSNLLVQEAGVRGVVIHLGAPAFGGIGVTDNSITAGGGAELSHVILTGVREGLAGLEGLVGIPGTVGGALHGNAGDRSVFVGRCLLEAMVVTRAGAFLTRTADELQFAYRESSLDELAIVSARFGLEREDRDELTRRMQKLWIVRRAAQPTRERRTACLFKDPMSKTATEVIEEAGLKGYAEGGVALFDRDCNFVIVSDEATTQDVLRLLDFIRKQVARRCDVELELAIEVW
jgi:UDP-N-acetylmuramate dehydrogenase